MKIVVLANGSGGDVQRAIALASPLVASGHTTSLVAPNNFTALAAGRGIDFRRLPINAIGELHDLTYSEAPPNAGQNFIGTKKQKPTFERPLPVSR